MQAQYCARQDKISSHTNEIFSKRSENVLKTTTHTTEQQRYQQSRVNRIDPKIIIIILITRTIFIVLSSWPGHCESSLGSSGECRAAPSGRRPSIIARNSCTWVVL